MADDQHVMLQQVFECFPESFQNWREYLGGMKAL
jgi:hypothetical protein